MSSTQTYIPPHPETDLEINDPSRWVLDGTANGKPLSSHISWIVSPRLTKDGLGFRHYSDSHMGRPACETPLSVLELLSTCDRLKERAVSESSDGPGAKGRARTRDEIMADAKTELTSLINTQNRRTAQSWVDCPKDNLNQRGYTPEYTLLYLLPEEHDKEQYIRRLASVNDRSGSRTTVTNDPVSQAFEHYKIHGVGPRPDTRGDTKRTRFQKSVQS